MVQYFEAFGFYSRADVALAAPKPTEKRAVFLGDSIFNGWHLNQWFPGKPYLNRGIGGQSTAEMLLRFEQDVVHLRPRIVVILAGINDLAGWFGPVSLEQTEDNYDAMASIAQSYHIAVVFGSVMPINSNHSPEVPRLHPASEIVALDVWLRSYCLEHHIPYVDYYAAMADGTGAMREELTLDGLHPNAAGYAVMAPLTQEAIDQALAESAGAGDALERKAIR